MANFAVSLTNPTTSVIALTADNGTLTINDYSNYITSTEEGHLLADFSDYKRIIVENPSGTEYVYSTLTGGDETILTPDAYGTSPIQTIYQYTDDGVYEVTLEAIPTWSRGSGGTWTAQVSGVEGLYRLESIFFITSSIGWCCGENGTILYTSDGGTTWTPQTSGTTEYLQHIHFIDVNNGWCCGWVQIMLHTSNGGTTWVAQTLDSLSGAGLNVYGVHFTDANNGWACGSMGKIDATTDGGTTWVAQTANVANSTLNEIFFINSTTGWAVANSGKIIATTDGGTTWTPQTSGTAQNLDAVHFINTTTGWVCGASGIILKTTNGGATWNSQISGTSNTLLQIFFTDTSNGWCCGYNGTMRVTTDGGTTWTLQTSGSSNVIDGLHFIDSDTGWFCTTTALSGEIRKYTASTITFEEDDCVYRSGNLYQASQDAINKDPLTETDYWDSILAGTLPEKYRITERISITDESETCYAKKVYQACCKTLEVDCNDEMLCKNKVWLAAIKMDLALASIPILVTLEEYEKVDVLINEIYDLCDCCT